MNKIFESKDETARAMKTNGSHSFNSKKDVEIIKKQLKSNVNYSAYQDFKHNGGGTRNNNESTFGNLGNSRSRSGNALNMLNTEKFDR